MEASRPRSTPLPAHRIRDTNVSSLEYMYTRACVCTYACVIAFKLLLIRFLLNISIIQRFFILLITNDHVFYISLSIKLNSYMLVLY